MTTPPAFHSIDFLEQHIRTTMAFYDGRCVDPDGGFFHYFLDDGTVNLYVGTQSNGQGHETVYAQFLSDQTGIPAGETGWILETNEPMNRAMEGMGGEVVKRYRIYELGL